MVDGWHFYRTPDLPSSSLPVLREVQLMKSLERRLDEVARRCGLSPEAVIAALWPVVLEAFSARHGAMPGRGAAVIGMGSLGAQRLNAGSDLDLIVIYDAAGVEASSGPRPLATRPYYARLTQALVTALTRSLELMVQRFFTPIQAPTCRCLPRLLN